MAVLRWGSAYVPHDIRSHLIGAPAGPLAGLTIAIKDMFDIAGECAGAGNPEWLAAQTPASRNSAVVDQILAAGGRIVGKTVCDEFFYSVSGTNIHYGTPLNSRAPDRVPGGSSSGSASACSSGSCDIAIGSDTAGSVRVPAALCGLYGIRSSRGRMNLRGSVPMAPSFDAGGWFAASPGLFGLAGSVLLANWMNGEQPINALLLATDAFCCADKRIGEISREFLGLAKELLPQMGTVDVAEGRIDSWREALRVTQAYETWQSFGPFLRERDRNLGPDVQERMRVASEIDAAEVGRLQPELERITERMEMLTADRTVLVLPVVPSIAPRLNSSPQDLNQFRVNTMRLVCMASISGLPQVTMPIGTLDGAPIGLSFLGWRNGDEALLQIVKRLSRFVGCNIDA